MSNETKRCPCCKGDKLLNCFHVRKDGKPQSHCKVCQNEANRDYRKRVAQDPERMAMYRIQRAISGRRWRESRKEMGRPIIVKPYLRKAERYTAILQLI